MRCEVAWTQWTRHGAADPKTVSAVSSGTMTKQSQHETRERAKQQRARYLMQFGLTECNARRLRRLLLVRPPQRRNVNITVAKQPYQRRCKKSPADPAELKNRAEERDLGPQAGVPETRSKSQFSRERKPKQQLIIRGNIQLQRVACLEGHIFSGSYGPRSP